jgi:hypothetical protein
MSRLAKKGILFVVLTCAASALLFRARVRASVPTGHYVVISGTVSDTKTKLTWQQNLQSADITWADAATYCAGLGRTLGGLGWRLPTVKELQTLVDDSVAGDMYTSISTIDPNSFPNTPTESFWSSTPVPGASLSQAFSVSFRDGDTGVINVSNMEQVRCVR